jgi:hypothetical protein
LDVYDEGVGGARQFSLIYTAHRAGGVVFLRVTDDNARFALARNAGLFLRREEQPRAPNGKIGYAEFDTSHPVNQRAVNRVLHGLPAEVSEGGDAA